MNERSYYCLEHRPKPEQIPWGYSLTPDFEYHQCAHCEKQSRVELAPKPMNPPRLTTA